MAISFDCDWEDGSDEKNTGGTHVWDGISDTANRLSFDTSSAMWDTNSLKLSGSLSAAAYVYEAISGGSHGIRIGFMFTAEGIASGNSEWFYRLHSSGNNLLLVKLYDNSGTISIGATAYDTGATERAIGTPVTISKDTKYQIIVKITKNTAGGAAFSIYAEDGTTIVGAEQTLSGDYTTANTDPNQAVLGCTDSWLTHTFYFDIVQWTNTYAYPDTVQAAGGTLSVKNPFQRPFAGALGGPF